MARVTIDLRDVRGDEIHDPRVLVRFVNLGSDHALVFDAAFNGAPRTLQVALSPGSMYRVEMSPTRFSPALRTLMAVDEELNVSAVLIHRASEWLPAFTPWATLTTAFTLLQNLLERSPQVRVGRNTSPVHFIDAEYDNVLPDDESRVFAKVSLLNMYALLVAEPRPGTVGGNWFDGIIEAFLATRERIIGRIDESDARLIERIKTGAHSKRYKSAPANQHVDNFGEIEGFDFDKRKLFSVKTRDQFGNLQLTVARGTLDGAPAILLDADCDENGAAFAHLLDLPKHAVTGGTHPIEIHDILASRDPNRDLGYALLPRLSRDAQFVAEVEARITDIGDLSAAVVMAVQDMAVVGDSVPWGQGLRYEQKMHELVREALGAPDIAPERRPAHSGAVIGVGMQPSPSPPVHGEVPRGRPTILEQVAQLQDPDDIDLLILNGGINDLDIRYILNPRTSVEELTDDTMRVCDVDMGFLLEDVCQRVTKATARIVVLSCYPMLSADSDFIKRGEFLDLLAVARPGPAEPLALHVTFWDRIIENCATFASVSSEATRTAIARVNAGVGAGRIRFAAPPFGPENAALASKAWLFGLTAAFGPEDPVKDERRIACDRFETDIFRRLQCYRASAGHPNRRGAVEFAAAVLEALR